MERLINIINNQYELTEYGKRVLTTVVYPMILEENYSKENLAKHLNSDNIDENFEDIASLTRKAKLMSGIDCDIMTPQASNGFIDSASCTV